MRAVATKLHPDLVPYIETLPLIGLTIDHPLVRLIPLNLPMPSQFPDTTAMINATYLSKSNSLEEALAERDWETYIFLHERPYRAEALNELVYSHDLKPKKYWSLVGVVWIDSSNIWQNFEIWEDLWGWGNNNCTFAMSALDRKSLKALPDEFTVWRGVSHSEAVNGLSWTTDRAVAIWFAHRGRGDSPQIAKGRVKKSEVLAMFATKESEIVVRPESVREMKVKRLKNISAEQFATLKKSS